MRRADKEITSHKEMDAVLNVAEVCRMAMVDGNLPYVVAMNYAYDGKSIYLHSAPTGRKLNVLAKNPNVCIEVDTGAELITGETACKCSMRYRSVIVQGTARIVTDRAEKLAALHAITQKYAGDHGQIPDAAADKVAVIRVGIIGMTAKVSPPIG